MTGKTRTVEGRLLMADFGESAYRCRIDFAVGEPVSCTFPDSMRDKVLAGLTRFVRATGEASEDGGRVTSLAIAELELLGADGGASFFDEPRTIEELAAEQGVKPVTDLKSLVADFWPEDETADDFIAAVRAWRREGTDKGPK